MPIAFSSRSKALFWGMYGQFVWNKTKTPSSHVERIITILTAEPKNSNTKVLDAGCGTGMYALALAQAGFTVTGIDYSSGILALARAKRTTELAETLSFHKMNLDKPLLFRDNSFDHIINISVLQVVADPLFTLRELRRVLKPGGLLVLLHVPKPSRQAGHEIPFRNEIRHRIDDLEPKTLLGTVLVAVKFWAERSGRTQYWTPSELQEMLKTSQYNVRSVDKGPPLIFVAEKPGI